MALDRHCLSLFDGEKSLGEIADALVAAFPGRFDSNIDALNHVTKLAGRYPDGDSQPVPPSKKELV